MRRSLSAPSEAVCGDQRGGWDTIGKGAATLAEASGVTPSLSARGRTTILVARGAGARVRGDGEASSHKDRSSSPLAELGLVRWKGRSDGAKGEGRGRD